ncbi:MAG TPA: hypothetical protein VGD31_04355 [Sphingobacteriaceae bacterium]
MLSVIGKKTLEVKLSRANLVMAILLGLFLFALGVVLFYKELTKEFSAGFLIVEAALVMTSVAIPLVVYSSYRKLVNLFTEDGLTRQDGQKFLWSELESVTERIARRGGSERLWRIDFRFKNGGAWVIPGQVANFDEVSSYIEWRRLQNVQ